ncbi:MAG: YjgP/YjgQ family permease [Chlamydiae bacterium]|nr:YjgP/YjgQ family permease [Chlamydiota bacterium]
MPILWKYLLRSYVQYLVLCLSAFIAILLVIRFQEIAVFASSGAKAKHILLFSLYQIPYILPIALPISCLISSMILFQRMSSSLEMTVLRASGISLRMICYPLLWASFFFNLLNFCVASELAPCTRILAKNLMYDVVQENPLIVLQKEALIDLKAVSFDMKDLHLDKKAKDVLCVIRQPSSERIGIITAKELALHENRVCAKNLSFLTSAESPFAGYDHIFLENQQEMQTHKAGITAYLLNTDWFAKDDLLSFSHLIFKVLQGPQETTGKLVIEVIRRLYLGFCPMTFTLIGMAFGTNISRRKKKHSVLLASSLALMIMLCFLTTKTVHNALLPSFLLLLIPQPVAAMLCLRSLHFSSKGVEA